MDYQYYPTPPTLAKKMWDRFEDREFVRVLEPSAGCGALATAIRPVNWHRDRFPIDVCEIDVTKHPTLRSEGLTVVGTDFLTFQGGAIYSHIIQNPPFSSGAAHVLRAWDCLWAGEIVSLVNAQTLRNPCSPDRRRLLDLIEKHGSFEYLDGAFNHPDTERQADVEVALIHLKKLTVIQHDFLGDLIGKLPLDRAVDPMGEQYQEDTAIALPSTDIELAVRKFDMAVEAMQIAVMATARAERFEDRMGVTMGEANGDVRTEGEYSVELVRSRMAEGYDRLKNRAWTGILRSAHVLDRLSSSAQKRVEAEFEDICKLQFSASNIYGFFLGLAESAGEIQREMLLDVFDAITRQASENSVLYRGWWKSNDRHRTCGMRIKTTRFILSYFKVSPYGKYLDFNDKKRLSDIDKVFAILDGRSEPEVSLCDAFFHQIDDLWEAKRVRTSYFDLRYFKGKGTLHVFPTNKALIDRLNVFVGKHRAWLPASDAAAPEAFWNAFQNAEKYDAEIRAEAKKGWYGSNPVDLLTTSRRWSSSNDIEKAIDHVDKAAAAVHLRHGIDIDLELTNSRPVQLELTAPAEVELARSTCTFDSPVTL